MTDDSRWEVDTTMPLTSEMIRSFNAWGHAFRQITNETIQPTGEYAAITGEDVFELRDFIVELVHEIERLQEQVILKEDVSNHFCDLLLEKSLDYAMLEIGHND